MSFARMQEALRAEGWFVEWNLPCCQSCAWGEVEHDDLSKVLFNHSQDCEVYDENEEECDHCDGTGFNEDDDDDCDHCEGEGFISGGFQDLDYEPDTSVGGFVCMPPNVAGGSTFCFDGTDEGVANFKAIIPLIEESGCKVSWNGSGDSRPDISWEKN
jgi:hypothetical protein